MIGIITNPVNSTIPIAAEVLKQVSLCYLVILLVLVTSLILHWLQINKWNQLCLVLKTVQIRNLLPNLIYHEDTLFFG